MGCHLAAGAERLAAVLDLTRERAHSHGTLLTASYGCSDHIDDIGAQGVHQVVMKMPARFLGQEPFRTLVCKGGIGQDKQKTWVLREEHPEGLFQVVSDKYLVVSRWQPRWGVNAGEEGSGGGPEPKQLGVVGKGGCVAVAHVIESHTMPSTATGWEATEAPKFMWLQFLAQPQCPPSVHGLSVLSQ